jgi:hypothetical protein
MIALNFATNGGGKGVVLTTRVPFGMVFPNSSPDKYREGEVQIYGVHWGIPTLVGSRK